MKSEVLRLRIDRETKDKFFEIVKQDNTDASKTLYALIEKYINEREQSA